MRDVNRCAGGNGVVNVLASGLKGGAVDVTGSAVEGVGAAVIDIAGFFGSGNGFGCDFCDGINGHGGLNEFDGLDMWQHQAHVCHVAGKGDLCAALVFCELLLGLFARGFGVYLLGVQAHFCRAYVFEFKTQHRVHDVQ